MKNLRLISFFLALSTTVSAQEKSFSDHLYSGVNRLVTSVSQFFTPTIDTHDTYSHLYTKQKHARSSMHPSDQQDAHNSDDWKINLHRLYAHVAHLYLEQRAMMPDALKNEAEDPEFYPPIAHRDFSYITSALRTLRTLEYSQKSVPHAQEIIQRLYQDLDDGMLSEHSAETLLSLHIPVPEEVLTQYRSKYGWIRTVGFGLTAMLASQYAVGVAAQCTPPDPARYHSDQAPDRGIMQVCEDSLFECWTRHAPIDDMQAHDIPMEDIQALYELPSYRATVTCLMEPGVPSETCMDLVQETVNTVDNEFHSDIIAYRFSNATETESVYGHPYVARAHYDKTSHELKTRPSSSYATEWAPYPVVRQCTFWNQGDTYRAFGKCDQVCGEGGFTSGQRGQWSPLPYLSLLMNFKDYVKVVSVYDQDKGFGLSTFLVDRDGEETQVLWEGVVTDQTYMRVPSLAPRATAHTVSPPAESFSDCADYACLLKSYQPDLTLINTFNIENDPVYEAATRLLPIEGLAVSTLPHLGNFTRGDEGQFLRLGEIDAREPSRITYTTYRPGKGPATRYNPIGWPTNNYGPFRDAHTTAHRCTFHPGTEGEYFKTCEVDNAYEGILDTKSTSITPSEFEQAQLYVQPGQYIRYFELRNQERTLGTFLDMNKGGAIIHQGVWPVEGRTKPSLATRYDQASYATFQNYHTKSSQSVSCSQDECGVGLLDWAKDYASRTPWVQGIVECLTEEPDPDVCFNHLFNTLDYARLRRFTPTGNTLSVQVHNNQDAILRTYSLTESLPNFQTEVYQLEYYPWMPKSRAAFLVQVSKKESETPTVSYSGILSGYFSCPGRSQRPDCQSANSKAWRDYNGVVKTQRLMRVKHDLTRTHTAESLAFAPDTFIQKWPYVLEKLVRGGIVPQTSQYTVAIKRDQEGKRGEIQMFCWERTDTESWQVLHMAMDLEGSAEHNSQDKIKVLPGYSGPCEQFKRYQLS